MTDTTMGTAKLAAALAKVQAALPDLERDRTVEVVQKSGGTYSYSYATLANLSKLALPLLAKHGLAFTTLPGTGSDGKMCVRYHLMHESGESLSGEFPISGEGGIQMIGGRITYARRYCLAAVIGLAADEDDETQLQDGPRVAQRAQSRPGRAEAKREAPADGPPVRAAQRQQQPAGPPPLPGEEPPADGMSDGQQRKMQALMTRLIGTDRDAKLAYASEVVERDLGSSKELTRAEAAKVIDRLEAWERQDEPPAGPDRSEPS